MNSFKVTKRALPELGGYPIEAEVEFTTIERPNCGKPMKYKIVLHRESVFTYYDGSTKKVRPVKINEGTETVRYQLFNKSAGVWQKAEKVELAAAYADLATRSGRYNAFDAVR